jgi:hypothetical protein
MSPRAPIVVWCNHGIQGEQGDVVQRYRWHANQGKWIPSDNTAEANTFVPESVAPVAESGDETLDQVTNAIVNRRQHYNARCKKCPRLVAMGERGAQVALTRIWELGLQDVPLAGLRRAYEAVPPVLR